MNLPFTRKETDYLRSLVEQEKLRLIEDISAIESRENMPEKHKEIMRKVSGVNYFKTKTHLAKMRQAVKEIKGIESQLYPKDQDPNIIY